MAILDFTEIPKAFHPKGAGKRQASKTSLRRKATTQVATEAFTASTDLDAFEKFASEFFTHVCGCKVIESIARGQDGGRDLVVEGELSPDVKGKFLVSCKHKAGSGDSVATDKDEPNAGGRLTASGAQFFVGFYSTIASAGLRRHLEDTRRNQPGFDFVLFNSGDIESRLISVDEPRGWLLAARYFPKSMGNLFRRFVVPINYYKPGDVKQRGATLILIGPYGETTGAPSDALELKKVKEDVAKRANDDLTSRMHLTFFCDALTDFIRLLPNAFVRLADADATKLSLEDVAPNYAAVASDLGDGHQTTLRIVAAVWSFWEADRAVQWFLDQIADPALVGKDREFQVCFAAQSVTIGRVARICHGEYRDILARLVAFCPATLSSVSFEALVMRNGKRLGREEFLRADFERIVSGLNESQRDELAHFGGRISDENGWKQLVAILGLSKVTASLDALVGQALEMPAISLGDVSETSTIGFDRTALNRWLEDSLGLGALQISKATVDSPAGTSKAPKKARKVAGDSSNASRNGRSKSR